MSLFIKDKCFVSKQVFFFLSSQLMPQWHSQYCTSLHVVFFYILTKRYSQAGTQFIKKKKKKQFCFFLQSLTTETISDKKDGRGTTSKECASRFVLL